MDNRINIAGEEYILIPAKEYMADKMGRAEIREYLEVSNVTLTRKPWMFPDFGKALKGHVGVKPYTRGQVMDWLSIPEKKRKKLYLESKGDLNETNKQD